MVHFSGGRFKFWNPGYINQPEVSPPAGLLVVFVLCIVSVIGTLLYSIAVGVSVLSSPDSSPTRIIAICSLNFVLPIAIAYTIYTNHPSSRYLLVAYVGLLVILVLNLSNVEQRTITEHIVAALVVALALILAIWWLFGSRTMQCYFALVAGRPVPAGLEVYAERLTRQSLLSFKTREYINTVADNVETIVLLGFVILAVVAFTLIG